MKKAGFTVIWEFRVNAAQAQKFEAAYGQDGDWACLFRLSPEYQGTELLRDTENFLRYVTIDRWSSQTEYEQFRKTHKTEYEAIDKICESFTEEEVEIGRFA
jgi:heme-degrading monooxygenase HmoA